jgi:hypothetical protein
VDDVEQVDLIRGSALARTRSHSRRWRLQAGDVPLEFRAREAAAAADVDRTELSGFHERVHRGAADTENTGGLLGRQQNGSLASTL